MSVCTSSLRQATKRQIPRTSKILGTICAELQPETGIVLNISNPQHSQTRSVPGCLRHLTQFLFARVSTELSLGQHEQCFCVYF